MRRARPVQRLAALALLGLVICPGAAALARPPRAVGVLDVVAPPVLVNKGAVSQPLLLRPGARVEVSGKGIARLLTPASGTLLLAPAEKDPGILEVACTAGQRPRWSLQLTSGVLAFAFPGAVDDEMALALGDATAAIDRIRGLARAGAAGSAVALKDGSVALERAPGPAVNLAAGERCGFAPGGPAPRPERFVWDGLVKSFGLAAEHIPVVERLLGDPQFGPPAKEQEDYWLARPCLPDIAVRGENALSPTQLAALLKAVGQRDPAARLEDALSEPAPFPPMTNEKREDLLQAVDPDEATAGKPGPAGLSDQALEKLVRGLNAGGLPKGVDLGGQPRTPAPVSPAPVEAPSSAAQWFPAVSVVVYLVYVGVFVLPKGGVGLAVVALLPFFLELGAGLSRIWVDLGFAPLPLGALMLGMLVGLWIKMERSRAPAGKADDAAAGRFLSRCAAIWVLALFSAGGPGAFQMSGPSSFMTTARHLLAPLDGFRYGFYPHQPGSVFGMEVVALLLPLGLLVGGGSSSVTCRYCSKEKIVGNATYVVSENVVEGVWALALKDQAAAFLSAVADLPKLEPGRTSTITIEYDWCHSCSVGRLVVTRDGGAPRTLEMRDSKVSTLLKRIIMRPK